MRFIHDVLSYTCDAYTTFWIVSQVQVRVLDVGQEQISDHLVVDFNIGHFKADQFICLISNSLEKVLQDENHDAWLIHSTGHGVSFTRTCSSIREYASIISFDNGRDQLIAGALVHINGRKVSIENTIKEEPLLATPMQNICLFVIQLVLYFCFVHDNLNLNQKLSLVSLNLKLTMSLS